MEKLIEIKNVSLDIRQTRLVSRTEIKTKIKTSAGVKNHLQTDDFIPDKFYKIIEPCLK